MEQKLSYCNSLADKTILSADFWVFSHTIFAYQEFNVLWKRENL